MERRNITKPQNPLGKYNGMWYNIIPYGLGTIYFLHRGLGENFTKGKYKVLRITPQIKVATKRDSVKPQSKTNLELDLIGSLLPKMESRREL